jgi:hypothetical protein
MTTISRVTAALSRRQLHKRSGFAVAKALKEGAMALPPGPLRTFIAKNTGCSTALASRPWWSAPTQWPATGGNA